MNSKSKICVASGLLTLALSTAYATFFGTTYSWVGGAGNWSDSAKWSPTGVPDAAGEEAVIGAAGTYTVSLNVSPTIDSLSITNAGTTLSLAGNTITAVGPLGFSNSGKISGSGGLTGTGINNAGGFIDIPTAATLTLNSPTWTNNGEIRVNPTGVSGNTTLNIAQPMTISGTGLLSLGRADLTARLLTAPGASLTQAAGHTIQGRGRISAVFTNNGSVIANVASNAINIADQNVVNNASFSATSSGALTITGVTVTQGPSGVISADANGQVNLVGGSIVGGTLQTLPGTNIRSSGASSIANLTLNGNFFISQATSLQASGNIVNNGILNVNVDQVSNGCTLNAPSNLNLLGTGTVQLSANGSNANFSTTAGAVVTNGTAHTIKGRGMISGELINNGQILADWSGLDLDLNGSPKLNNNLISAVGGGNAYISGTSITQGANGRILADSGNVGHRNGSVVTGGKLQSNGSFAHYVTAGTATLNNVTNEGTMLISQATNLQLGGTSTVNNGLINLNYNQVSNQTKLRILENHTLTGSGVLQLSKDGTPGEVIGLAPSVVLTQGPSHTIQGRGFLSCRLINNGIIDGNWAGSELLLINDTTTNNGAIRSNNGGSLGVAGTTITQTANGTIQPLTGDVNLYGPCAIIGGRILASPGTNKVQIESSDARLENLTNDAVIHLNQAIRMQLAGSIVNNGLININPQGVGNQTHMRIIEDTVLSGSGTIQCNRGGLESYIPISTGKTLTVQGQQTIQGWGFLEGQCVNHATFKANQATRRFEIRPLGTGFINHGLMEASNTGYFDVTIGAGFENRGTVDIKSDGAFNSAGVFIQASGATLVNGTLTSGNTQINGGILKGSGTVNGSLTVAGGKVEPGNSAGKLTVQGSYNQNSSSELTVEIGGTTQITEYDLLAVSSQVTVDGKLKIKLINGFTPALGTTFTIVTGSSLAGTFDEVVMEGSSDYEPVVTYNTITSNIQVTFLEKLNPTNATTLEGMPFGGSLSSLFSSDNNWYSTLCDESESNGKIEFTTTSPFSTLNHLRFAVETSASRADLTERVEMFNYTSNTWVTVGPLVTTMVGDKRRIVIQATNMTQFVAPGTRELKVRLSWIPQADLEAADGWGIFVDQAVWFVSGQP